MIKTKLSIAIAAFSTLAAAAVSAQETANGPVVEEVIVTGSRIARDPLSTTGPITILDSAAIKRSGVGTIDELLNQLPSMGTTGINANDNNGGAGLSFVDLRNLGSARTLVLVNGRRFVSSSSGVGSAVDMNNIPVDMIERIEVLTDGASAVYGSDAVAGVINVVLKKAVDGALVSVRGGATENGGGENGDISLTFGSEGERGSFIANISHSQRDEITYKDRDWASLNSSITPNGNVYTDYGSWTVKEDGSGLTAGATSHEIGQYMWLSGALERSSATANGTFALTDSTELYGEASYTTKTTNQQLAAQPMYGANGMNMTVDHLTPAMQEQLMAAWDKAEQAYQIDLAAYEAALAEWEDQGSPEGMKPTEPKQDHGTAWNTNPIDVRLRPVGGGSRDYEQTTDTYRVILGARGDFANSWSWDTFYSYGKNEGENVIRNSYNKVRLEEVLEGNSPIANPQYFGGIGADVLDYIRYDDRENNEYELVNAGASLTGDIDAIQFQGGALGFAAGVEYREESGEFNPSVETQSGDTFGNQQDATAGEFSATEVFAEFNLPILAGMKYAEELTADLAVRYSDFDTFGGESTGKLGLVYAPTEDVRFRTSYSTSFRAPGIYELFSGTAQSYEYLDDPCYVDPEDPKDKAGAYCASTINVFDGQVPSNIGGNSELTPEEATTFTAGVVWTPSFFNDFSITLDYFDIEIENAITSRDLQQVLDECYEDNIAASCALIQRNDAYNITALEGALLNIGTVNTKGVDIDMTQNFDFDAGQLALRGQATRLLEFTEFNSQTGKTTDYEGYIGTSSGMYVKWRALTSATWYASNWNVGVDAQYIDSGHSPYLDVPSTTYINLKAGWDVTEAMSLSAGIDNIADREPFDGSGGGDWNSTYDYQGRYFWAGASYQF